MPSIQNGRINPPDCKITFSSQTVQGAPTGLTVTSQQSASNQPTQNVPITFFPITFTFIGTPEDSSFVPIVGTYFIPQFDGSVAWAGTSATSTAVFSIVYIHNGQTMNIGTVTFSPGSNYGVFDVVAMEYFSPDDIIGILAPTVADETLANVGITIFTIPSGSGYTNVDASGIYLNGNFLPVVYLNPNDFSYENSTLSVDGESGSLSIGIIGDSNIVVSGSPVTDTGTINLSLSEIVQPGSYNTIEVNAYGRVTNGTLVPVQTPLILDGVNITALNTNSFSETNGTLSVIGGQPETVSIDAVGDGNIIVQGSPVSNDGTIHFSLSEVGTAGTYSTVIVDAYGRVTYGISGSSTTSYIELESDSGFFLLEDASGYILQEN